MFNQHNRRFSPVGKVLWGTAVISFFLAVPTGAMHIMEGFLPPIWCVPWFLLCVPFVALGIRKMNKTVAENPQFGILLAMAGAFAFILSALKIPSVTGSSSHMTGLGFAAILFGPTAASVLGLVVLLFQALLLAHGGLTTLGANTFSMGIVGPLVSFGIYTLLSRRGKPNRTAVFFAAALGDLSTYVVTSLQLAMAHPSEYGGFAASLTKFLSIFAVTQVPLAIVEGILTVVLLNVITTYAGDPTALTGEEGFHYAE